MSRFYIHFPTSYYLLAKDVQTNTLAWKFFCITIHTVDGSVDMSLDGTLIMRNFRIAELLNSTATIPTDLSGKMSIRSEKYTNIKVFDSGSNNSTSESSNSLLASDLGCQDKGNVVDWGDSVWRSGDDGQEDTADRYRRDEDVKYICGAVNTFRLGIVQVLICTYFTLGI